MAQGNAQPLVAGIRTNPSKCTDLPCCALFAAAVACLAGIGLFGHEKGNMAVLERFDHGKDWKNNTCGQSPGFEKFGYVFFALPVGTSVPDQWNEGTRMSLKPVCTDACPQPNKGPLNGLGDALGESVAQARPAGVCPQDAVDAGFCTWYNASTVRVANYCVDLNVFDPGFFNMGVFVNELYASRWSLIFAPVVAIALGFALFKAIYSFGTLIVLAAYLVMTAIPAALGTYLFRHAHSGQYDALTEVMTDSNQYRTAFGLWGVAALLLLMMACQCASIKNAGHVISATAAFIEDVPSQMLSPILFGFMELLVAIVCAAIFVLVASVNASEGEPEECMKIGNVFCVQWTGNIQKYLCTYVVLVLWWTVNFFVALSYYGTSWAMGQWYFASMDADAKRHPFGEALGCCHIKTTLKGLCSGLSSHPGSLAFGAALVTACQVIKVLFCWARKYDGVAGNPVTHCVFRMVNCLVLCLTSCVEFISNQAFVEIALTGKNFCVAAKQAVEITARKPALFTIVSTVVFGLAILCMLVVGAGTAAVVGLIMYLKPPAGLASPVAPLIVSGVIGVVIGEVMFHPMSAASRAALHCLVLDEDQTRDQTGRNGVRYAPGKLSKLAEEHSPQVN